MLIGTSMINKWNGDFSRFHLKTKTKTEKKKTLSEQRLLTLHELFALVRLAESIQAETITEALRKLRIFYWSTNVYWTSTTYQALY